MPKSTYMMTLPLLSIVALTVGCQTAVRHQEQLSTSDHNLTVGLVQKEIHVGMSQSNVAAVLGSPNIVTNDQSNKETWVYDKIASEVSYSRDSGGVWLILGGYQKDAGAVSSTQRTLTVVIKFDTNRNVESVSYHSSKF